MLCATTSHRSVAATSLSQEASATAISAAHSSSTENNKIIDSSTSVTAALVGLVGFLEEAVPHLLARAQGLQRLAYGEAHSVCESTQFLPFFCSLPYGTAAGICQGTSLLLGSAYRIGG